MNAEQKARRARAAKARRLRAEGRSLRDIAAVLRVSASTVLAYVSEPAPEPAMANIAAVGNNRAESHGAHRRQLVEPRARELVPDVLELNRHLDGRDAFSVFRYAYKSAQYERIASWLDAQPDAVFTDAGAGGEIHAALAYLAKLDGQLARDEERLAIAPLTRTRLGLDQARSATAAAELWAAMAEAGDLARARVAALDAAPNGGAEGGEW